MTVLTRLPLISCDSCGVEVSADEAYPEADIETVGDHDMLDEPSLSASGWLYDTRIYPDEPFRADWCPACVPGLPEPTADAGDEIAMCSRCGVYQAGYGHLCVSRDTHEALIVEQEDA